MGPQRSMAVTLISSRDSSRSISMVRNTTYTPNVSIWISNVEVRVLLVAVGVVSIVSVVRTIDDLVNSSLYTFDDA
jgi:hypothetical protein